MIVVTMQLARAALPLELWPDCINWATLIADLTCWFFRQACRHTRALAISGNLGYYKLLGAAI